MGYVLQPACAQNAEVRALLWRSHSYAPLGSQCWITCPLIRLCGVLLAVLSFAMDLRWAVLSGRAEPASSTIEQRIVQQPPGMHHTSMFVMYIAYCFYPPLYLAGPIITYNSFANQVLAGPVFVLALYFARVCNAYSHHAMTPSQVTSNLALPCVRWLPVGKYALRFLVVLLCLEVRCHHMCCTVIPLRIFSTLF